MRAYLFWPKAAFAFCMLMFLIPVPHVFGQPVNELTLMGQRNGYVTGLIELGDYYYYSYSHCKLLYAQSQNPSCLLETYKFHKTSYSFQRSAISTGDTTQYDSAETNMRNVVWNGNIVFAATELYHGINAYGGLTFTVLDTAFNTVIPQRRLKLVPKGGKWTEAIPMDMVPLGERLAIIYYQQDTSKFTTRTSAILLDKHGGVLKDTPIADPYWGLIAVSIPGKRCMVSDFGGSRILLDSNLAIADTFLPKPFLPNGPYIGYMPDGGYEITLPSGTLIKGGEYTTMPGLSYPTTSLSRLTAASRYDYDTTIYFRDNYSIGSDDGGSRQSLQFNSFDNRIYYANSCRQKPLSGSCLDSFNYIQVICADTLLHTLWRKFVILTPHECATAYWVAASNARGGVGVMGYYFDTRFSTYFNMYDTTHSGYFLFHVDSTGSVSVGGGRAPTVRDRLKIYPNPARDAVVIDDILGGLSGFALYDMSGRQISSGAASGKLAKASLARLSAGPYIMRILFADGSAMSQTIIKQ